MLEHGGGITRRSGCCELERVTPWTLHHVPERCAEKENIRDAFGVVRSEQLVQLAALDDEIDKDTTSARGKAVGQRDRGLGRPASAPRALSREQQNRRGGRARRNERIDF
jgi:hypothetical protein